MEKHIELVPNRRIIVAGDGIYKVLHDEFFGALKSRAFRHLRILRVSAWANPEIEQTAYFRKRNPSDYLKLTVYMSSVVNGAMHIDTRFNYLARRVQMELAQRWARVFIRRRSKQRAVAFCMAMHPRLGQDSVVCRFMPADVMRCLLTQTGVLKYIEACA